MRCEGVKEVVGEANDRRDQPALSCYDRNTHTFLTLTADQRQYAGEFNRIHTMSEVGGSTVNER